MVHLSAPLFLVRERDDYQLLLAKQRSSVLWLLSKAYMPKIPSELYEPCYRDHEGNDRLKPQVVHALANAELYCLALANIYADPNYHNLNHHGILQVLMRKGIEVMEPPDAALTETVLVQTAPIRMSAHMAVIEGIMALFIKEVLIPEKVIEVVSRFSVVNPDTEMPYDCEEAALLWINKSCIKMRHRIEEELGTCHTPDDPESSPNRRLIAPTIALAQDLGDLSDGCCLAALLSLYCPKYFRWQDIRLHDPMSLADSVHNLQLVQKFCQEHLPQDIYCLTLEDMVYLHPSVMQNVLALIADIMYIFEIRPPKYISRPGVREEELPKMAEAFSYVNHNGQRQSPLLNCRMRSFQQPVSPIPDLRSGAYGSSDLGRTSPRSNGSWQQRQPQKSLSARRISAPDDKRFEGSRSLRRTHSMNLSDVGRYGEGRHLGEPASLQSSVFNPSHQRYHMEEDEELAGYFSSQYHQQQQTLLDKEDNRRTRHASSDNPTLSQAHQLLQHSDLLNDEATQGHLDVLREHNEMGSKRYEDPKPTTQRSPSSYHVHQYSPSRQDFVKEQGYSRQRSHSDLHLPLESRPSSHGNYTNKQNTTDSNFDNFHVRSMSYEQHSPKELPESNRKNRNSFSESPKRSSLKDFEKYTKSNSPRRSSIDCFDHEDGGGETNQKLLLGNQTWKKQKDQFSRTEWNKENVDHENDRQPMCQEQDSGDDQMNTISFADLSKQRNNSNTAINIVYMQQERDQQPNVNKKPIRPGYLHISSAQTGTMKSSPLSPYSNMPQWTQENNKIEPSIVDSSVATQMHDIRLKLEEKRKRIEQEKHRLETLSKKQREKVGKVAFLQAVKGGGSNTGTPVSKEDTCISSERVAEMDSDSKHFSLDDITEDLDSVRRKWLEKKFTQHDQNTTTQSEEENDLQSEDFQASIEQLNCSLTDLQSDISKLTQQQDLIQKMLKNNAQTPSQMESQKYYLHEQKNVPQETGTKWRQPVSPQNINQMYQHVQTAPHEVPHMGRGHWGQPVMPFSGHQQQTTLHNSPMWQTSPLHPMRPSSVEPQMMTGYPITLQSHLHDRPPSAVPFTSGSHQGFSLHPQQQSFGLHIPHSNSYQNDPTSNYFQEQYRYGIYQQPSYNVLQAPYPPPLCESQPQMPHQNSGFHLHQSPSMTYVQNQGPNMSSPNQETTNQRSLSSPQSEVVQVPNPPPQTDISNAQEGLSAVVTDDFGRPLKNNTMQHSPPNRPVLGKTFRVSKPKVVSPSSPNCGQVGPFVQQGQLEQTKESQIPSSPVSQTSNDKGFYISFDDCDQPRKPKPRLKPKHLKAKNQQKKFDSEIDGKKWDSEMYADCAKDYQQVPSNSILVPTTQSYKQNQQKNLKVSAFENERNVNSRISDSEAKEKESDSKDESEDNSQLNQPSSGVGFVIGTGLVEADPDKELEMTRRKEMIMIMSLRRRAEQESKRNAKQQEYLQMREKERVKKEQQERKKEEEKLRRQLILEQYRQRKAKEDTEDGTPGSGGTSGGRDDRLSGNRSGTLTRPKSRSASVTRPKPKGGQPSTGRHHDMSSPSSLDSPVGRGSQFSLSGGYHDDVSSEHSYTPSPRRSHTYPHSSPISPTSYPSSPAPLLPGMLSSGRSRGTPSDGLSDTSSTISSAWASEYTGPKLFVKPATKSNRGIITNAVNTVLAGAVNSETKRKVIEEMDRSDGKHFLILFRDAGCQFRALYSYNPETDEVLKLYGIGPRVVTDKMMDRFYKYNSGGKSFTQIHTKHLTATIDAFTIQNSLWQGKKAVPQKRDYF